MHYKAFHLNSSSLAEKYIGSHCVSINGLPDYARNDDFSLIFTNVTMIVVEELDEECRSIGQLIGFQKANIYFWYGIIVRSKYNNTDQTWTLEIQHIIKGKYADYDLEDVIGYENVDVSYLHSYDLSTWGLPSTVVIDVMAVLQSFYSKLLPTIITSIDIDFSTSALTDFNNFFYSNNAIMQLIAETKIKAFDYLSLFCKSFAITIRISGNTLIFRRLNECPYPHEETYNSQVSKEYLLKSYNKYEQAERIELEGQSTEIAISDYYQDLIAYRSDTVINGEANAGTFAIAISKILGFSKVDGFVAYCQIETPVSHGFLIDYYTNLKLISPKKSNTITIDNFAQAIDEEYEYYKYKKDGTFYTNDTKKLSIWTEDYTTMPRIETTFSLPMTISEAGGKVLVTLPNPLTDYGLNPMSVITITGIARFNGIYYGDIITGETNLAFKIQTPYSFTLERPWKNGNTKGTAMIMHRHIIRTAIEDDVDNNYLDLSFYDDVSSWAIGSQDVEILNSENEEYPDTISYNKIYAQGTGIGEWKYEDGYVKVYVDVVLHKLRATELHNELDIVKKHEKRDNVKQIEFPKHFFFFKGVYIGDGGRLLRLYSLFPSGTSNYLIHLNNVNIETSKITDETINIDDLEDVTDVIHKQVVYNVRNRSIDIKQQEIE